MTYNIWDLGRDSVVDILTKTTKIIIEPLLQRVVSSPKLPSTVYYWAALSR